MIVTIETRLLEAYGALERARRHVRELYEEEHQALSRRDYAAATAAARARMLNEMACEQACAVIARGGRNK